MTAKAPLPKLINAVGDRIGLNYKIDRKKTTQQYIERTKDASRLDYEQLKNSFYSLSESKTKKADSVGNSTKNGDNVGQSKHKLRLLAKNPLKLSSKIRKSLYKLSNEEKQQLQYCTFEKVHELWQQYSTQVVGDKDLMSVFRMDLHGSKLKCTASRNPTLVGLEGIVVQETKNTFLVITQTNRLLTLPKRESIFEFSIGNNVYRIHGCNLLFTTQTRSKVKYKQKKCFSDI